MPTRKSAPKNTPTQPHIQYIYSHPQTDCFIQSELFSVARHVGRSKPGSKPIQLCVRLSLRLLGHQVSHFWLRELLKYLCSNSSSSVRFLHIFYTLSVTRVLNSFEELLHYASSGRKFLRQSAQPPWGGRVYIYIYIYIYIQGDPPQKKTEPINYFYYFYKNKAK